MEKTPSLHSRLHTHADVGEGAHTKTTVYALLGYLPLASQLLVTYWEIFVQLMMTEQCYYFLKSLTLLSLQTGATAFWTLHFELSTSGEAYRNLAEVLPILSVQLILAYERYCINN